MHLLQLQATIMYALLFVIYLDIQLYHIFLLKYTVIDRVSTPSQ